MKKHIKFGIPFSILFLIIPLVLSTQASALFSDIPHNDWGIAEGDEIYMTYGWDFDVEMGYTAWEMIDYLLYNNYNEDLPDSIETYYNLTQAENIFNSKMTIINLTSYMEFLNRGYDLINYNYETKTTSMKEYGLHNETLIYMIEQNVDLFDYYGSIFGWSDSASEITDLGIYPDGVVTQRYYYNENGSDEFAHSHGFEYVPIFVPLDFNYGEQYQREIDEFENDKTYDDFFDIYGIQINSWDQYVAALGLTSITVKRRELSAVFKLSSMNHQILDEYVKELFFEDPNTHEVIDSFNELLDFLNITQLDVELNHHVEWTKKGILNNHHKEIDISGYYEGEHFHIFLLQDTSRGEHSRLNVKYTIPGFPTYFLIATAVSTVMVILFRLKKKYL